MKRFSDKCLGSERNTAEKNVVIQDDEKLENIRPLVKDHIDKFKRVDVSKCNNSITKIRVCNDNICGEGNWRAPTVYESCKMLNLEEADYKDKKEIDLDKLLPDCFIIIVIIQKFYYL